MKVRSKKPLGEKLGLSLSLLCSVHCLAMPFVIAFLPSGGEMISNPVIEVLLLGSSILLASYTLIRDFRHIHRNAASLALLGVGIVLLLTSQSNHSHSEFNFMAPLAGLVIFAAFLLNWRHNRRYHRCAHPHAH
jgi:drug/metabolite transporter (DMT)-like permease